MSISRLLFSGDVALASSERFIFQNFPLSLCSIPLVFNLEGAFSPVHLPKVVYNSAESLSASRFLNMHHATLSNNHIFDLGPDLSYTFSILQSLDISYSGAGSCLESACKEVCIQEYVLFSCSWHVIGSQNATTFSAGVPPLDPLYIIRRAKYLVNKYPGKYVIFIPHWNFESEHLPQPLHRSLAHSLIDLGVYAVIGHHPHVVGPVEIYRGRTIAYSLGNFLFSHAKFNQGHVNKSLVPTSQALLEVTPSGDYFHHCMFYPPNIIRYITRYPVTSPSFGNSDFSSQFSDFDEPTYISWCKSNRSKKLLLPLYTSSQSSIMHFILDWFVFMRQFLITTLCFLGLKK